MNVEMPTQSSVAWSGGRVVVTGASGFLGSHLCHQLKRLGAVSCAVSRQLQSKDDRATDWRQLDVSDVNKVRELLNEIRPDTIFHLTSYSIGSPDLQFVLPTFQNDLEAAVNLLTAATEIGCRRVVLAGSLDEPRPDGLEVVPASPYAAAKWASSTYARMFHALYHTPVVITRPFMTYGPRQRAHKLIPYVVLSLLQGRPPKLSSGQRLVDWIYVDDVVSGLLAAALAPGVDGCTIDLGSGVLVSIRGVVERIVDLMESPLRPLFGALPDRPMEPERAADTCTALARLGWKPETSLEIGLEKTVNWFREQSEIVLAGATKALPEPHE